MAIDFDSASSEYLVYGNLPDTGTTSDLTLSFWVKRETQTQRGAVFRFGADSRLTAQIWDDNPGRAVCSNTATTTGPYLFTTATFTTGVWTHVLMTIDADQDVAESRFDIYFDNVHAGDGSHVDRVGSNSAATDSIWIGGYPTSGRYVNGKLAEIALWDNTRLSSVDRASLASGICPLFVNPTDLVCYFPFRSDKMEHGYIQRGPTTDAGGTIVDDHPAIYGPIERNGQQIIAPLGKAGITRLRDPWVSNIDGSDFRAGVVRRPG